MARFEPRLKNYKLAKGTIQFSVGKPLPTALLKKTVKARVAKVEKRSLLEETAYPPAWFGITGTKNALRLSR
jgi:uncharacterized protein YdhG (YjbR/CyaY superfamily)